MRIGYFCFHEGDAAANAGTLRAAGHAVEVFTSGDGSLAALDRLEPEVIVIDLRRLPSHGRMMVFALRERRATRAVPLVLVEGDAEKTARVRGEVPDAVFAPWSRIRSAVRTAVRTAPAAPIVPRSTSGYSGTPLPKKLGVKPGSMLLLLGAPDDFERTLGELPPDAVVRSRAAGAADVIVLFADGSKRLAARLPSAKKALAERGALWIAWPKKASGVATDLTENVVRHHVLPTGLVDTKVCAIDATWSGLQFRRRRKL